MHLILFALILSFPVYAQERVKENIKQLDGVAVEEPTQEVKEEPVQKKAPSKSKSSNDVVRKQ